jgi:hypothetical protein
LHRIDFDEGVILSDIGGRRRPSLIAFEYRSMDDTGNQRPQVLQRVVPSCTWKDFGVDDSALQTFQSAEHFSLVPAHSMNL